MAKLTTVDGKLIGQMEKLVVDSESSAKEKDEIRCHFYLREKTEVELLREQVATLTAIFSVHDGTITDIGVTINSLAAEGGRA